MKNFRFLAFPILCCLAALAAGCSNGSLNYNVSLRRDLTGEDLKRAKKSQASSRGEYQTAGLWPLVYTGRAIGPYSTLQDGKIVKDPDKILARKTGEFPYVLPGLGLGAKRYVIFDAKSGARKDTATERAVSLALGWRQWTSFSEDASSDLRAWDLDLVLGSIGLGHNDDGTYGKLLWIPFGPGRKKNAAEPILKCLSIGGG